MRKHQSLAAQHSMIEMKSEHEKEKEAELKERQKYGVCNKIGVN